jgi:hypothetical protein
VTGSAPANVAYTDGGDQWLRTRPEVLAQHTPPRARPRRNPSGDCLVGNEMPGSGIGTFATCLDAWGGT